ncbi:MAG: hypothetical protein COX19_10645 [Desulfobacterales bacterium CG23_combo_of_CG06-09_8_20_14_all_51_8]|nr:MAG: hypothetical protein COX19_10645 [Desulfobacterales bacterium CG23_combo_of_CG06-09_8_20_14_all_51_8]
MIRNSFSGNIKFLFLFVLISLCVACSIKRHYDPTNQVSIDPESLPNVTISSPVTLINSQDSNEETLLWTVMSVNEFYGNLHLWTEETIRALTQAIELKGGKVVENSDKVIKVSVVEISVDINMWTSTQTAYVTVIYETGNNIRKKIIGSQTAWAVGVQYWVLDNAIEYTITDLLKDEEIINYLNN